MLSVRYINAVMAHPLLLLFLLLLLKLLLILLLERYKRRHNGILETLADWLASALSSSQSLFVDITSEKFHPVGAIFKATARPDTVIRHDSELFVLELTVCHESNL